MRIPRFTTHRLFTLAALLWCATAALAGTFTTPAQPAVSDQKAGSILVFPYYTSAADGAFSKSDTLLTITHAGSGPSVTGGAPNFNYLHLFFMNGCSPADTYVCLTPGGSIQLRASDYDPLVTGYLIAVAVNADGTAISRNVFIGSAFVRDDADGIIGAYGAESFACLLPADAVIAPNADGSVSLSLDGASYDRAPTQFSAQALDPSTADEYIVLASVSGNLGVGMNATAQSGVGLLYRADEFPASFQPQIGAGCFSVTKVDKTKIRIIPGALDTFLKDSYGYLKFNVGAPAVGLLLSEQGTGSNGGGGIVEYRWSGIRTLHKTDVGTALMLMPMFSPYCGF